MVKNCEGKAIATGEVASKIRRSIFGLCDSFYKCATAFDTCATTFDTCATTFDNCATTFDTCATTFDTCATTFGTCGTYGTLCSTCGTCNVVHSCIMSHLLYHMYIIDHFIRFNLVPES